MNGIVEKKPAFDFFERLFHIGHVITMILLILTGFQIHSASFNIFGAMGNARTVHFLCSWMFVYLGIWHIYRFFANGTFRTSMPHIIKNRKSFIEAIKYYLFMRDKPVETDKRDRKEYNELQKLTYTAIFILAGFQTILGFGLYWPDILAPVNALFGGLQWVRYLHYLVSWFFVFFMMVHLYLVFAEGMKLLRRMMLGKTG
ncbi:MAG: cytochrome b/b6 domain-containing protein [Spirochaetia bacterium]|nr:cytochrome b/b6 domain-containing protein [Spirochaetia bacterium]